MSDHNEHMTSGASGDEKVLGAIAYMFLLCLIPLLGKRKSEFAQFHAKQGLVLVVAWFAVMILGMVPVIGWMIVLPFGTMALILASVWGILNALSGKMIDIPVIGKYARRIHLD